jgi:hypothetical protein
VAWAARPWKGNRIRRGVARRVSVDKSRSLQSRTRGIQVFVACGPAGETRPGSEKASDGIPERLGIYWTMPFVSRRNTSSSLICSGATLWMGM